MDAVQKASENAVRDTLKMLCKKHSRHIFEAEDYMDDGSRIRLKISINPDTGSADFDFHGTSPQAYGMITVSEPLSWHGTIPGERLTKLQETGMRLEQCATRPHSIRSDALSMPISP